MSYWGARGGSKTDPKTVLRGMLDPLSALLGGFRPLIWRSLVVFGVSWAILERLRLILVRIWSILERFWWILARICRSWLEFGPSQGSILVLLRCSFAQVSRIARRRAEPHFDSVWASPNEVRRFRARVQNRRKIVPDTPLALVTQQLVCERRLFRVRTPQNGPQELSGAPWEASWSPLERSWITLGSVGAHWGAPGALSEHSWSDLRAIMIALGIAWTILDRPWVDFGAPALDFEHPKFVFRLSEDRICGFSICFHFVA